MEKMRKANIFENCTCQQVNKAKNTADKQRSPRLKPLLTAFARSDKRNFLIHGELTEANTALCFFSETGVISTLNVFFQLLMLKLTKKLKL